MTVRDGISLEELIMELELNPDTVVAECAGQIVRRRCPEILENDCPHENSPFSIFLIPYFVRFIRFVLHHFSLSIRVCSKFV